MEKIQIILNSKTADQYINNNTTDCIFRIPVIEVKRRHKAHISLTDAVIPYSFYNVNDTNDKLDYVLNGLTYNVIIEHANYNISTLITYLKLNMDSGFTINYNSSTNKITFTHSTFEFTFLNTSTCQELLGFVENTSYSSNLLILTSVIGINFFTIRNVQITSPNFILNNINTATPNKASIITSIPVNCNMGCIINYNNINNISSLVHEISNINNLHIQILDQDGDLLNLNGLHWSINLLLTIE